MNIHGEGTAMSVQQQLGLEDDGLLMQQIRERWSTWAARDPRLAAVAEFGEFRGWLRSADVGERDGALCALARLAARDGSDEVIAAAALAWAVLPGACTLAAHMGDMSAHIDELVAAQLWIEARSFPWRRGRRVAANILRATRAGVLCDLGTSGQVGRTDRVWARTDLIGRVALDKLATTQQDGVDPQPYDRPTPDQEIADLLAWGVAEGLISEMDRRMLGELVEAAETTPPARGRHTCNCGLSARELTRRVAPRLGVSPATVRRHVKASIAALAAASDRYVA